MRNSVIIPVSRGGGSVPVIAAPQGSYYAAIAYFTAENGDYDNYGYAYVNNQLEFDAQFCNMGIRANFELSLTAGSSDKVSIATGRMFGFYFGSEFDMTSIGGGFLAGCYSFNQPLVLPEGITSIGYGFLNTCAGFNSDITFPESVTYIGDYFMLSCGSFNRPLVLPAGITAIGNTFMSNCYSFNQPLEIPASVTGIGSAFMNYCYSFNQQLTLPSGITGIGNTFMNNCYSFGRLVANCNAWPVDGSSLATSEVGAGMYVNGVIVEGDYAAEWKAGLPDSAVSPYRKLILGPVMLPETSALLARMEQQPAVGVRNLIDKTISDMKDAGIWDLVKRLYCRRSHTMQAALLDWKGLSDGTAYGSVGFRAGYGVKGDGSAAYIDNGWEPFQVLTANACGVFIDVVTLPSIAGVRYVAGASGSTTAYFCVRYNNTSGSIDFIAGGRASDIATFSGGMAGFYAMQRTDSQTVSRYRNGTDRETATVAYTGFLANQNLYSLSLSDSSGSPTLSSDIELGWEGYGDVMTDQQQQRLFEIINYYNRQIINLL